MSNKATESQRTRVWAALDEVLSHLPASFPKRTKKSERARRFSLGKDTYISLKVLTQKDLLVVEFRTDGPNADTYYQQLLKHRSEIDRELGSSPTWRAEEKNTRRQIMIERPATLADESQWPEYISWLVEKLKLFYRVFSPRVDELRIDK